MPRHVLRRVVPDTPAATHPAGRIDPDTLAALVPGAVAEVVLEDGWVSAYADGIEIVPGMDATDMRAIDDVAARARAHAREQLCAALERGAVVVIDGVLCRGGFTRDPRARIAELLAHANGSLTRRRDLAARLRDLEATMRGLGGGESC